jgi:hypothetical protein
MMKDHHYALSPAVDSIHASCTTNIVVIPLHAAILLSTERERQDAIKGTVLALHYTAC